MVDTKSKLRGCGIESESCPAPPVESHVQAFDWRDVLVEARIFQCPATAHHVPLFLFFITLKPRLE